jgi:hypothetical protein
VFLDNWGRRSRGVSKWQPTTHSPPLTGTCVEVRGECLAGALGCTIVGSVLLRWEGGLGASGRARDADRDRAGLDVDLERLEFRAVASVELIADLAVELHAH